MRKRFNPAQKQNVKRKACKQCQSTGWCHAMQKCDVTGRALRIVRQPRDTLSGEGYHKSRGLYTLHHTPLGVGK